MSAAQPAPAVPDEANPRRWAILGVLVVSLLIVVLDNTVLNIALPTIQRDLGATQSQLVWSVDAYVLVFASLLFTWGVLGDKYGRKKILIIGLAIFAVGSAACSVATSPGMLIALRALMGIGGAAVTPVTLAIITVVFPPRERGRAIGMWAAAVGAAVALGPVLGGLLLQNPQWFHWLTGNDWGSVFLINVPIVAIGIVGIVLLVPESRNQHARALDIPGLVVSVSGLSLMVYGIINANTHSWLAASVLGPILAGAALLALFIVLERRSDHASFDVSLFRNRGFSVSLSAVSLAFFALSGITFTLPFYLQIVRGNDTLVAGLMFLPFAVGQILGAPRSAKMVARFGARFVVAGGLFLVTLALVGMTQLSQTTPTWVFLGIFFFFGFGMGNVIAPSTTIIQNVLPIDRVGAGSAVQNTVRQVFGAFGVAILGTILTNQYASRVAPTLGALPAGFPEKGRAALGNTVASVPHVLSVAQAHGLPASAAETIRTGAFESFLGASHVTSAIAAVVVLSAALLVAFMLPTVKPATRPAMAGAPETVPVMD